MSNMDTQRPITNEQIASDIGVTHSMVSRIRSGDRLPGYETMRQIERTYHWTVAEQIKARDEAKYAEAFMYRVKRHYVA